MKKNVDKNPPQSEQEPKLLDVDITKVKNTNKALHEYSEGQVEIVDTSLYKFTFPGTNIILRKRFPLWVEEIKDFKLKYNPIEKQLYCWNSDSSAKALVFNSLPNFRVNNQDCYIPEQVLFTKTDNNKVVEIRLPYRSYETASKNDFFGNEGGWCKLNDDYFYAQLYVNRRHPQGWRQLLERRIYLFNVKNKILSEVNLKQIKLKYPNYEWDFLSVIVKNDNPALSLTLKKESGENTTSLNILLLPKS